MNKKFLTLILSIFLAAKFNINASLPRPASTNNAQSSSISKSSSSTITTINTSRLNPFTRLKEKIANRLYEIKESTKNAFSPSERLKTLAKSAYALFSINNFTQELGNDKKIDSNPEDNFLTSMLLYYPNIITNYLLLRDSFTPKKLEDKKEITQDSEISESKKQKILKSLKTLFRSRAGIKTFGYATLASLNSAFIAFVNYTKFKQDKDKATASEWAKFSTFWTLPGIYLSARLAKNAINSFKEGYKKLS